MINPILIIGADIIGKIALEIFKSNDIIVYGFLDDDKTKYDKEIDSIAVLGSPDDDGFLKLIGKKCDVFVASDDSKYKYKTIEMLNERRKVMPVNAIHSKNHLSSTLVLGFGNLLNSGVNIGTFVTIGNHNIFHTNAIIEAQATIGSFVQIGAGSIIGTNVIIEDNVFIGSGATIVSGVKIGAGARIGAGSVVVENVKPNATLFGNPAKSV
ncbi:MAG: acetyltransferase [Bacteroidetes bacterium]|nr:MAG: acetyltransferase [Bacteroidota bacterium]TAG88556.1 MAG: acetyltransferase [Bacteroidota bacterium]